MLDYLHLPDSPNGTIDYFPGFSTTDGGSWVVWEKPRGAHMIRITCIAGGGGGGSGLPSATITRGGGAGGGSSAISIVTIPAYVLPDRLYVSSGIGGKGGVSPDFEIAGLGNDGIRSYVCIAQDTGVIYRVCYADSGKAGIDPPTTTPTGGSAGSGGTVATIADMLLASHGIRNFIAGQNGIAGASNTTPNALTYPTTGLLLSGGGGGMHGSLRNSGATNITAPTQTADVIFTTIPGGTQVASPRNGIERYQPLLSTGGAGGSSGNASVAGVKGGNGGFGSGGGGGGAAGATSGDGGKGGNGLVVIHTW